MSETYQMIKLNELASRMFLIDLESSRIQWEDGAISFPNFITFPYVGGLSELMTTFKHISDGC